MDFILREQSKRILGIREILEIFLGNLGTQTPLGASSYPPFSLNLSFVHGIYQEILGNLISARGAYIQRSVDSLKFKELLEIQEALDE